MAKKTQRELVREASAMLLGELGNGVNLTQLGGAKSLKFYWEVPYKQKHAADRRRFHIALNGEKYIETAVSCPADLRSVMIDHGYGRDDFSDNSLLNLFWVIVDYTNKKLPETFSGRIYRAASLDTES